MIWCFLLYYFARRRGIHSKIAVYFQTFFYKYLKTFNLGLKKILQRDIYYIHIDLSETIFTLGHFMCQNQKISFIYTIPSALPLMCRREWCNTGERGAASLTRKATRVYTQQWASYSEHSWTSAVPSVSLTGCAAQPCEGMPAAVSSEKPGYSALDMSVLTV